MARRKAEVFGLSFMDCICCGFGATILLYMVLNSGAKDRADRALVTEHGVDRPVLLVQLDQDVKNDLVIRLKKRIPLDDLNDIADHLLIQHHRRQQAHLRLDRVRRQLVELIGKR